MSALLIILALIVGVPLLIILFVIGVYNALIRKRIRCREAWSQIDVQLKRRYDLIPNLVETVKGYAAHERETLEAVIQARNAAIAASGVKEQADAENMLTGALRQLFAVAERYPNLKASTNFLALQKELANTEDRIQAARRFYNANARDLNTRVHVFPSNLVAAVFAFKDEEFFEIEQASARAAPGVNI